MRGLFFRPENTLLVFRAIAQAGTRPALAHAAWRRALGSLTRINPACLRAGLIKNRPETPCCDELAVTVNRYKFRTAWHLEAPVETVWDAIVNTQMEPRWWPFIEAVSELVPGDASGVGSTRRYVWRTKLPYKLSFDITVARVERPVLLEGVASGEVEGIARWEFESQGATTIIRHYWSVRLAKRWMNFLAPLARPVFAWNHGKVMKAGGEGLARFLGVRLLASGQMVSDKA